MSTRERDESRHLVKTGITNDQKGAYLSYLTSKLVKRQCQHLKPPTTMYGSPVVDVENPWQAEAANGKKEKTRKYVIAYCKKYGLTASAPPKIRHK